METPGRKSLFLASQLLELIGVLKCEDDFIFSENAFKLYTGVLWWTFATMTYCGFDYARQSEGFDSGSLMALAVVATGVQLLLMNTLLFRKRKSIGKLVKHFKWIHNKISKSELNWPPLEKADKFGYIFSRIIGASLLNVPLISLKALIQQLITGETHYPFEMSDLGVPMPIAWTFQLFSAMTVGYVWLSYHAVMNIFVYLMSAYCSVLCRMLRERSVQYNPAEDRDLFSLYTTVRKLALELNNIFSEGALIEILMTSTRCALVCCILMEHIKSGSLGSIVLGTFTLISTFLMSYWVCSAGQMLSDEGENIQLSIMESNWYASLPKSRKKLLPLLLFSQSPFYLNFKRGVSFNMETFGNVIQTTYTFITFLANLISNS